MNPGPDLAHDDCGRWLEEDICDEKYERDDVLESTTYKYQRTTSRIR